MSAARAAARAEAGAGAQGRALARRGARRRLAYRRARRQRPRSTTPRSAAPACCASTTMEELFDAAETLALTGEQHGDRLAILTNGGGAGVLATDALERGRRPARRRCPPDTHRAARSAAAARPGATATRSTSSATRRARAMPRALEALLADDGVDAILVLNCPTALRRPRRRGARGDRHDRRRPGRGAAWPQRLHRLARRAIGRRRRARLFSAARIADLRHARRGGDAASCTGCATSATRHLLMETPPARPERVRARRRGAPAPRSRRRSPPAAPGSTPARSRPCSPPTGMPLPAVAPRRRPGRSRGGSGGDRLSGGAEDPLARHHAQIAMSAASRSTSTAPRRCAPRPRRCWRGSQQAQPKARLDGFLVQQMVRRPRRHRAARRARRRRGVRAGRRVRPGRHRGRDHRRQRARPAAAQSARWRARR